MVKARFTMTRLVMASLLAGMLACCCQIVGVFGPAWATTEQANPGVCIQNGVWYSRACTPDTCVISNIDFIHRQFGGMEDIDHTYWHRTKAFTLWSVTQSVFTVVIMALLLRKADTCYLYILLVFAAVSATLSNSAMFIAVMLSRTTVPKSMQSDWTKNWSRSIATISIAPGLISIAFLVCSLLKTFVFTKNRSRQRRPLVMNSELPCVSAREVFSPPPYAANDTQASTEPPPAYTEIELPTQRI